MIRRNVVVRADPRTISARLSHELRRTAITDLPPLLRARGIIGIDVRAREASPILVNYRRAWGPADFDTLYLTIRMRTLPEGHTELVIAGSRHHNLWIGPLIFAGLFVLFVALEVPGAGWVLALACVTLIVKFGAKATEREDVEFEYLFDRALETINQMGVTSE
jgi:hypothetical protein